MSNTITNVLPKLLAQGLMALRQNAILPQLVNKSYQGLAAQKGNVINVPIPSAISTRSVTPAVTFAANVDTSPTVAVVTLDRWREAPFQLNDNDMVSVMDGFIPMQASEAIKSLGNDIDTYILSKHTGLFSIVGTAGTTPFNASLTAAASARGLLNKTLAPMTDRCAVIDPDAEALLLQNSPVLNPFASDAIAEAGIIQGSIGRKLGVEWYMDQNLTANTYTPGTAWTTSWTFDGSNAIGATTAAVVFTGSGTINVGDIFTLTSGGLGYVITVATTMVTAATQAISFYPGLRAAVATASALLISGSTGTAYVPNLMFHRDCFAFASRPLADIMGLGHEMVSATDPVTGIALRLEVSRQYKQTTFSYDILCGAACVRPELGAKIKG